jgi:hypothetical protein
MNSALSLYVVATRAAEARRLGRSPRGRPLQGGRRRRRA